MIEYETVVPLRKPRMLMLDGDRQLGMSFTELLAEHGIDVITETDGAAALARFKAERPDIVVLDLTLPNKDGYQLCRELRAASGVPILVHTARDNDIDHVLALELGADDFVVKPMEPRVLMAHVMALMRRAARSQAPQASPKRIGDLAVNRIARLVTFDSRRVDFTGTEFDLFWLLFNNCGEVVTRDEIMRAVHKRPFDGIGRAIDGRVFRVRKKLVDAGANPDVIRSVRSAGYLMVEDELRSRASQPLAA